MIYEAKITYGDAVKSSDMIQYLESKKQEIASDWTSYISTTLTETNEIISEKLIRIFGGKTIGATTPTSNSQYSLVELTLDHDFLRIANHDSGDKHFKQQMKNTPDIVIHDFQFISGASDSYDDDVLQLNSPVHGIIECLRETIVINANHLFVLNDVISLIDSIIRMLKEEGHTFHLPFSVTENNQYNTKNFNNMKNTRNRIRLTESHLRRVIKESVGEILAKSKKDPMSQWFDDFNKASKFRETMDYVNKGGKNPIRQEVKEGYDYPKIRNL